MTETFLDTDSTGGVQRGHKQRNCLDKEGMLTIHGSGQHHDHTQLRRVCHTNRPHSTFTLTYKSSLSPAACKCLPAQRPRVGCMSLAWTPSLQIPMPLGTSLNTVILAGAIKYWLYVPRHAGPTPAKAICRAVAALRPAPLHLSAGPLLQAYSNNNCLVARPSSASADCRSFLKLKVSLLRICIWPALPVRGTPA